MSSSPENGLPLPGLRWRGLTLRMFLFIFLPLTIILLVVVFSSQTLHHHAMRSLVGDRDLRSVRASANALDQLILQRTDQLSALAGRYDPTRPLNTGELSPNLFDGGLILLDARATLLGQTIEPPAPLEQFLPLVPLNTPQRALLTLPPDITNGEVWAAAVEPLASGQTLIGFFRVEPLVESAMTGVLVPGQTTVRLISAQGGILFEFGSFAGSEDLTRHPGLVGPINNESGIDYFDTDTGEHVVAFAPVASAGWRLMLEETWEDISNPTLRNTQLAPLALVPVLLITMAALWYGAQNIVRPLQKLEQQAAQLSTGDFKSLQAPVGGIDEIRHLQSTLTDMAGDLETAQASLRGYIGAITAGVENERLSLARDLHDDTLQGLIALNQRVQLAAFNASDDTKRREFEELQNLIQQTISNLRRMVRGLRPIYLEDLGLSAALGSLADEIGKLSGLPVQFASHGAERRLPPAAELAFYRIAQEALSNVLRHSAASHAWLELEYLPLEVELRIRDDGQGFIVPENPAQFAPQGHYGLVGMHERAELIGAALHIQSSAQGTIVNLNLEDR